MTHDVVVLHGFIIRSNDTVVKPGYAGVLWPLCIFFCMGVFYHQAGDSATMGRCSLPNKIPVYRLLAWSPWCPTCRHLTDLTNLGDARGAKPLPTVCHPGDCRPTAMKNPHCISTVRASFPTYGRCWETVYVPGLMQVWSASAWYLSGAIFQRSAILSTIRRLISLSLCLLSMM